jgi:hypothetical protein
VQIHSKSTSRLSKQVLQTKLLKAQKLANKEKNNRFFEIHERDDYFMKDAIDKKHGFYFLRVGTNSD